MYQIKRTFKELEAELTTGDKTILDESEERTLRLGEIARQHMPVFMTIASIIFSHENRTDIPGVQCCTVSCHVGATEMTWKGYEKDEIGHRLPCPAFPLSWKITLLREDFENKTPNLMPRFYFFMEGMWFPVTRQFRTEHLGLNKQPVLMEMGGYYIEM